MNKLAHQFATSGFTNGTVTRWELQMDALGVHLKLVQGHGTAATVVETTLMPDQAEDLREMLALYQNSRRRAGGK